MFISIFALVFLPKTQLFNLQNINLSLRKTYINVRCELYKTLEIFHQVLLIPRLLICSLNATCSAEACLI